MNPAACRTTVYEPGYHTGWGPRVWRMMAVEAWSSRGLAWRLFLRDFVGRYKQTFTGLTGAVVSPVASVATLLLLNKGGVLDVGDTGVPYPVFAILSLTIWGVFSGGVGGATNAIVLNASFISKINFAREVLIVAAFGQTMVDVLIRTVLVAIVFALYGVVPAWTAVFAPLAIAPLVLLTLGLGCMASVASALVRDTAKAVHMAITFLLVVTPVLYAAPQNEVFATITRYNIVASLVGTPRDLVLHGTIAHPERYAVSSAVAVAVFFLGWRLFHLAEVRLAERMGAR